MSLLLQRLTLVCHQLQGPDNLGSIARLLANFGVPRLHLSALAIPDLNDAQRMAVHAQHVLAQAVQFPTLDEAIAHTVYAVGSTSREDLRGREALSPEEAVRRLTFHAGRGEVALVLGGEKRGLSDDELSRCQDVLVIPTDDVQPSMNVAQAGAVLLYLCSRADQAKRVSVAEPGARLQTVQALETRLQEVLAQAEFLNPQAPEYIRDELIRTLTRAQLTQREAELWLAALVHLKRGLTPRKG
jgi:tRNA/rRNA methyltransferase